MSNVFLVQCKQLETGTYAATYQLNSDRMFLKPFPPECFLRTCKGTRTFAEEHSEQLVDYTKHKRLVFVLGRNCDVNLLLLTTL